MEVLTHWNELRERPAGYGWRGASGVAVRGLPCESAWFQELRGAKWLVIGIGAYFLSSGLG